jgi:hypothetical protein
MSNTAQPTKRSGRGANGAGRFLFSTLSAAFAAGVFAAAPANAETTLLDYEIEGTVIAPIVDDNDPAFEQRHGMTEDPSGGIRNLYMEWLVGDGNSLKVEGRGLFDNHDYLINVNYEDPGLGKVDAGYREFRTFYDGSGGFFRPNGAFFDVFSDDMSVDRGEACFDSTLALPDLPEVRLRYKYRFRDGRKPSTAWGPTTQTGGSGTRAITNAANKLDENSSSVAIDISHTIDKTRFGAGFRYENPEIDNKRQLSFNPGEAGAERFATNRDDTDSDFYTAHAFAERSFLEQRLLLSSSYAYTNGDTDLAGSRIFGPTTGAGFDPLFANRQAFDSGFLDLNGDAEIDRHVGRVNVAGKPREDVRLQAAFRVEKNDTDTDSDYTQTDVGTGPAFPTTQTPLSASGEVDELTLAQSLGARYTGIDRVVFYVDGEWEEQDHEVKERQRDVATSAALLDRKTDIDRFVQKYSAGANWYPTRTVNLAAKYTYKNVDGDYDDDRDSTDNTSGDRYPAYTKSLDTESQHAYGRISWKPLAGLRGALRYDFRITDYDAKYDGLKERRSGRTKTHSVGAESTWTPIDTLYFHGNISYVSSETETPTSDLTGAADDLVQDFDNDYFTSTLTSGWSVTEKLDLEGRYFYYRADNYHNNSAESQPYGSDLEEHGVSAGLAYHFRENMTWTAKYAYFHSDDDLSGGHNDYSSNFIVVGVKAHY